MKISVTAAAAAAIAANKELLSAWQEGEARVIRDICAFTYSLDSVLVHVDRGGLLLASASKAEDVTSSWSVEAVTRIEEVMETGCTLIMNGISETVPIIADLACQLSMALYSPVSINAYATNAGVSVAAPRHFDAQDVLALQITGQQRWHLWDDLDQKNTFRVKPNDLVFIPAFTPHATDTIGFSSDDDNSFHLTFGLDFLAFALDDPEYPGRTVFPPGALSSSSLAAQALASDLELGRLYSAHASQILKAQHSLHSNIKPDNWADRFQTFWSEVTPAVLEHRRVTSRPDATPVEDDTDHIDETRFATELYVQAKLKKKSFR